MKINPKEALNEELVEELKTNKEYLLELNKRIHKGTFKFEDNIDAIYLYLYACNKFEENDTLEKLIEDDEFLKLLEQTNIQGSMIVSLTNSFVNSRDKILALPRVKESIIHGDEFLNSEDILDDIDSIELKRLRSDISVDNYLISNGLRFDALTDDIKEKLLKDYKLLTVYSNKVVIEFTNSLESDLYKVANDRDYLDIYVKALEDNYVKEDKIFNYINFDSLNYILSKKPSYIVLYHLVRSTQGDVKNELLKNEKVLEVLTVCQDPYVLETLPTNTKEYLLERRTHLLDGINAVLLYSLPKKDIQKLFTLNLYDEFIEALKEDKEINIKLLVQSLPNHLLKDLSENKIISFNNHVVKQLLQVNPTLFKKHILDSKEVCIHIATLLPKKDTSELEEIFMAGDFIPDEQDTFVNNCSSLRSSELLINLINTIPVNYRKNIYENTTIMSKIISSNNFELDEYTIPYLLGNHDEVLKLKTNILIDFINQIRMQEAEQLLENDDILIKLFKENKDDIASLINNINKKELIPYFTKDSLIKYYNKNNLQDILDVLSLHDKKEIFTNNIQKVIFKDEEIIKIYKALENKNSYVINTLYLNFLDDNIKGMKISLLEKITKSRELQEIICEINKKSKISYNDLVTVLNLLDDFRINDIINIFKIYRDSSIGVNRKKIGNIPKMLSVVDKKDLNNKNIKTILSYMLYLIPRYFEKKTETKRPILLSTPNTYNDILTYESRIEEITSLNIAKGEHVLENFLIRHFKLTKEEAIIQLKLYDVNKIDSSVYKNECDYLSDLNKIMNTDKASLMEMDNKYKIYSMFDSYQIENNIKNMYGKIYNYEIKTRSNLNKFRIEKLYGKEIKIYEYNNEFMFFLSRVDFEEEFNKTNSYLEAWHNTLSKDIDIKATLVSNDNLKPFNKFYFGFNGVLDKGIKTMSLYDICNECSCTSKVKYYHPFEMIDNTRYKNTFILDKYALRPNYNNSNRPYVEPDFILVNLSLTSDHTYLEKVVRAASEFKTKRNKDGLPIIGIEFNTLVLNEKNKLEKNINRYNKTKDMITLSNLITRLENNYSSYKDTEYEKEFDFYVIKEMIRRRVPKSNSISELEYILETLHREKEKFYDGDDNMDIENLEMLINYRLEELNS